MSSNAESNEATGTAPAPAAAAATECGGSSSSCAAGGAMVKLISADGGEFILPVQAAIHSGLIRNALNLDDDEDGSGAGGDGHGMSGSSEELPTVELLRVGKRCLAKVVEFLNQHHKDKLIEIPTPLHGNSFDEVVTQQWYRDFCSEKNMERELLYEVLRAGNYLNIKELLDLACLRLAFQLQGKNADEIRELLNLPEMTPEEEAQAREEHRWIFENSS